jgi:hypothetical protein
LATNDGERAGLVKDPMAYTGLIRPDGAGRFITTVDVAANPALIGVDQLRLFKIDGNRLIVATEEIKGTVTQGRPFVGDVVFIREHPAATS